MMIASAASAVVGYIQQDRNASAQQAAITANAKQANEAAQREYDQINASAAQEMSERAKEGMIERARLRVISGESGLAGVSTERIGAESYFNQGTDITTLENNRRNTLAQAFENAKAGRARSQSQMNSVQQPSLIGTGLQIAGGVAGGMAEQKRIAALTGVKKTS